MRSDRESRSDDRDDLLALFAQAISSLSDGELTFPAPFDLSTSAALAANDDTGRLAEEVFKLAAQRDCGYAVEIVSLSGSETREVINTQTASTGTLIALLEGLLEELYAKHGIQ